MATARSPLPRATSARIPIAVSDSAALQLRNIAVLAVGYFIGAKVGGWFASYDRAWVSPLWPPAGVAVAGLLLFGKKTWPAIPIAGFLLKWTGGQLNAATAGILLAQTSAPLLAASLLLRHTFDSGLRRVRDVLALIFLGGAVSMLASASIGTAALASTGVLPRPLWFRSWLVWWIGDAMGVILVAPLLLALASRSRATVAHLVRRRGEVTALLLSAAAATYFLFRVDLPLPFLVFPFALWAALRHQQLVVAAVNLAMGRTAVWLTVSGHGPFSGLPPTAGLVVLDAFTGSIAITALILGAAVATAAALNRENEQLHSKVRSQLEEVQASRVRLVQAADTERRRVERDLHDGAQRRLASLSCTLGLARAQLGSNSDPKVRATLEQASREMELSLAELRQLARGIHPTILTQEGLGAALESLAEDVPLPVAVAAPPVRYPSVVEATAYFVVSEALANAVKHAQAGTARVSVGQIDERLVIEVVDDGRGGADPNRGSGLAGLADRVAALEGRLWIDSPAGGGTRIRAEFPCASS
jgi:signal transduction histidine kinase